MKKPKKSDLTLIKRGDKMLTKQCAFKDFEGTVFGGVYLEIGEEKYVICGCCGGVMEMDDIEELYVFQEWNNISEEIVGDVEITDLKEDDDGVWAERIK